MMWDGPSPCLLLVVCTYKYVLGVVLAASCGWRGDDHVSYVADKATRRAFALSRLLRNRRMATAVR
jgi:hypothetical protein